MLYGGNFIISENNLNNTENGREPDSGINGLNGSFIYSSGPDSTRKNQSGQDSANQPQTNETDQNPILQALERSEPDFGLSSPNYRDSAPSQTDSISTPTDSRVRPLRTPAQESKGSRSMPHHRCHSLAIVAYGFYPIISSIGADTTTTAAAENETKFRRDKAPTLNLNIRTAHKRTEHGRQPDFERLQEDKRVAVGILVYAGDGKSTPNSCNHGEDEEHK